MKKSYQRDIYEDINEFILEYSANTNFEDRNVGLDFSYKGKDYRMCREYGDIYYLYSVDLLQKEPKFETIAICYTIEDLLENRSIANVDFKTIILDQEDTIIYGKD